jgi:deoxycytidine triphosphate deaminase
MTVGSGKSRQLPEDRTVQGEGVISGELTIFTKVNSANVEQQTFDERSFSLATGRLSDCAVKFVRVGRIHRILSIPHVVVTICVGKSTYARCGFKRERNAIRAGR